MSKRIWKSSQINELQATLVRYEVYVSILITITAVGWIIAPTASTVIVCITSCIVVRFTERANVVDR